MNIELRDLKTGKNDKYNELYNFKVKVSRDSRLKKLKIIISKDDSTVEVDFLALHEMVNHLAGADETLDISVGSEYRNIEDNKYYRVLSVSMISNKVKVGINYEIEGDTYRFRDIMELSRQDFLDKFTLKPGPYGARSDLQVYWEESDCEKKMRKRIEEKRRGPMYERRKTEL